ncbi:MAG TPA: flagellar biosynthetic protein FliQ [Pseudomonadota bacterium]|jgi:type III secretory pathway component EscS|nr:flagellar biosynthetic protein FliQ [Pseudomonadota bacterium]
MSDALLPLLTSALWLAVLCSLPIVIAAAVAAVITSWLMAKLGVTDSSLPTAVRLLFGIATLFVAGPYIIAQIVAFSERVWSSLS